MKELLSFNIKHTILIGVLALLASFLFLRVIYLGNDQRGYKGNDIFYIWSDGHEIAHGINPYSKIHGSDMLRNQKYSTYLPGFFLFVSLYVSMGYDSFEEWLDFWRPASFLIHFSVGIILFFALLKLSDIWLALFGSQFWLISRWPISVMNSAQIDPTAIFILLVSLLLLDKHRKVALIIFGLSLSVKQIGIFMLPVFLMSACSLQLSFKQNLRIVFKESLLIAVFPIIFSIPFLIWDPKGLLMSLVFSATRSPGGHIKVPSFDEILGYVGILAKIPMLFLMGFVYMLVLRKRIGVFSAGLAIFLVFISFNSVLFKQYMPWFCAFLGLALAEFHRVGNLALRDSSNAIKSS